MLEVIAVSGLCITTIWAGYKCIMAKAELAIERLNNELLHEDIAELRAEKDRRDAPLKAGNAQRSAKAAERRRARMAIAEQRFSELRKMVGDLA